MLHRPDDDSRLTPDQRRRGVASILARGILRLASETRTTPDSADPCVREHAPEAVKKAVEASAASRPHVFRGSVE